MADLAATAALLLAAVLGIWLVARLVRARAGTRRPFTEAVGPGRPAAGGLAAVLVGAPLVLLSGVTTWPGYVLAAAIGAFTTGAVVVVAGEIDDGFGTTFYSIPGLQAVAAGSPGARSAAGIAAGGCAALALPLFAAAIRLIGPGEAALIAVAALDAAGLDAWLRGRSSGGSGLGPPIAAALLGALTSALLVAFLP